MLSPDEFKLLRRFIATANAIMERYADLAERVSGADTKQQLLEDRLTEQLDGITQEINELTEAVKRLERLEILERTGNVNSTEGKAIRRRIADEHHDDYLRQEVIQHVRNLEKLKLRAAKYGAHNVPLNLQNEIDDTEEILARLQAELKGSESGGG